MKKRLALVSLLLVTGTVIAAAQEASDHMGMQEKTVEHERLQYLTGNWKLRGTTTPDCPYGAGKFTATEHNELMKGGLYLVAQTKYRGQFHDSHQVAIFGFDQATKSYSYDLYSSMGTHVKATGSFAGHGARAEVAKGDTWTWESATKMRVKGQELASQYVIEAVSPSRYNFKVIGGGGVWMTGVADKVSNPAP